MELIICGGNALKTNKPTDTPTLNIATPNTDNQEATHSLTARGEVSLGLFRPTAFLAPVETAPRDINDEYCISYHRLTDHEDPRQLLRQINQSNPGTFTSEIIDGIVSNLGTYFDIHYILHGGILIDYRFYDPFGDYINPSMLVGEGKNFTDWQMQVFDTLDHQYAYGLDDQMIEDMNAMIHSQTKNLM